MTNGTKQYSIADICRKSIFVVLRSQRSAVELLRKCRFYYLTRCWVKHILGKVHVNTLCLHTSIGSNTTLYPNTIFEVAQDAWLSIGNNFTLSYGSLIACNYSVTIGNDVSIGEYTSIRDTTHGKAFSSIAFCRQPDTAEKIIIGNNVWIGRGSLILPGTVIEDGVIVGAHSLVKGKLHAHCIYAGSPLKKLHELAPAFGVDNAGFIEK